jgi:hypothetical protein
MVSANFDPRIQPGIALEQANSIAVAESAQAVFGAVTQQGMHRCSLTVDGREAQVNFRWGAPDTADATASYQCNAVAMIQYDGKIYRYSSDPDGKVCLDQVSNSQAYEVQGLLRVSSRAEQPKLDQAAAAVADQLYTTVILELRTSYTNALRHGLLDPAERVPLLSQLCHVDLQLETPAPESEPFLQVVSWIEGAAGGGGVQFFEVVLPLDTAQLQVDAPEGLSLHQPVRTVSDLAEAHPALLAQHSLFSNFTAHSPFGSVSVTGLREIAVDEVSDGSQAQLTVIAPRAYMKVGFNSRTGEVRGVTVHPGIIAVASCASFEHLARIDRALANAQPSPT